MIRPTAAAAAIQPRRPPGWTETGRANRGKAMMRAGCSSDSEPPEDLGLLCGQPFAGEDLVSLGMGLGPHAISHVKAL